MVKQSKLHQELKDFVVNVGWTHKIHIVSSDRYAEWSEAFKIVRIITASITSSGLIGIIFLPGSFALKLFTAIFSFITVAMNSFDKAVDFDKLSLKEKIDANNFWELRIDAESLLFEVVYNTRSINDVEADFLKLKKLRKQYNDGLLNVSQRAVKKASKLINERRDNDYSNDYVKFISPELLEVKIEDKSE